MLHIQREIHDFAVLTRVIGEIDLNVFDELRRALDTALALTAAPYPMVVDLDGVSFLSSAGLAELVGIDERARTRGVEVRFVATRREVLRPLRLTGLLDHLDIRAEVDEALSRRHPELNV
ncbi:anti-sigma factor antagonist [Actinophytocola gossypii]|uniref:Anti-sigma factor antagonist n=1 Tax=Actinophytocola gossypii TaxID=2812003 RepID=A0ABT2J9A6_9PSEU|nr:anti-sigma factor antagonist [Actinophytocola gossypii]MCT2584358.1 anti-sigma factor antagonist [Actinophytocola gossypii]